MIDVSVGGATFILAATSARVIPRCCIFFLIICILIIIKSGAKIRRIIQTAKSELFKPVEK
jgi:Na+/alanine symporter